jgi:hypothetical protein
MRDHAVMRHPADRRGVKLLRHQAYVRAGATQQHQLGHCRLTAADQQGHAAAHTQEYRQVRQLTFDQRFIRRRDGVHRR